MSDLNFSLLPWQEEVFKDKTRFKVIAAGRRCGKSRMAAVTLLIEALKCPAGSAVLYVAPTNGQARQIIWQVLMELGREVIQNAHINNQDITTINGATIYVRGADRPDTLRGVSLTYAVLDEVADIKPEAWEQVIRASLSDKKGRAMFIGTPKGRNWFYDLFRLGESAEDKDWKSWHFTTKDNPLIDPTEIESAKKTLSTFAFKQEYMAERLGITQQSYSKLESDKTDVPFSKIEQLAEIFEIKPEDLVAFDSQYVFNNFGENKGHQIAYNNFPEQLKQLYEDKIKLLEDKVRYQETEIARLNK